MNQKNKSTLSLLLLLPLVLLGLSSYVQIHHAEWNYPYGQIPRRILRHADVQPLRKGMIDVTEAPYNAFGDGEHDDTEALQQALSDAFNYNLVVFLPSDKVFLVTRELECISERLGSRKFAYQMIGSAKGRTPVIRLKDNSEVKRGILLYFALHTNGKSNAPSFYGSCLRNVDIDMGRNPSVTAVSMSGAQHSVIEDVRIYGEDYNIGIYNLPGSGGSCTNIAIYGGRTGILQKSYRPNPSIAGLLLEGQRECGLKVLESRGPVIVTGFKVRSTEHPSPEYRAFYVKNTSSNTINGVTDHGNANLCLTDGSVEVAGSDGKAIYNYAQDVTLDNVFFKAAAIIESGFNDPEPHVVPGNARKWLRMNGYGFTSSLDQSSAFLDGKERNARREAYVSDYILDSSRPAEDLLTRHSWSGMPTWEDEEILDIMDLGATPEDVDCTDDDGRIIQAAIDQVTDPSHENYGKTVLIPRGHFHTARPILLRSGLKMIGSGKFLSVIQPAAEWPNIQKNRNTAILYSEDVKEGSLLLSDFAIWGFHFSTFLSISTPDAIVRDVVTESLYLDPSEKLKNGMDVPYISFTGNAGGRVYNLSVDHIPSRWHEEAVSDRHNLVYVGGTRNRLEFHQLSVEHLDNSPQMNVEGVENLYIYGFKFEHRRELLSIKDSRHIGIYGGSGNYQIDQEKDRGVIVIRNSEDVKIRNLAKKGSTHIFGRDVQELHKPWISVDGKAVTGDKGVLMFCN